MYSTAYHSRGNRAYHSPSKEDTQNGKRKH
nr:MAG TPA: hypothetical protein [Caudoviricetes sp.]